MRIDEKERDRFHSYFYNSLICLVRPKLLRFLGFIRFYFGSVNIRLLLINLNYYKSRTIKALLKTIALSNFVFKAIN